MSCEITNDDDIIDSREVIERIEELESELTERHEQGEFASDFDDWIANSRADSGPIHAAFGDEGLTVQQQIEELYALRKLAEQGENSPDWQHGESIIRDSYFADYTEQLIDDCFEMPKEMKSGAWPWRHMRVDIEAAAEELQTDYFDVDFNGVTYWIRG